MIDSSLFPTNLGVNPQHTIMAICAPGRDARGGERADAGRGLTLRTAARENPLRAAEREAS